MNSPPTHSTATSFPPAAPGATPSPEPGTAPSAAVVTCVEAGYLETQTIRMIESLRQWGGKLANCPVLAITPRHGAPLRRSTLRRYQQLGVEYHKNICHSPYIWYNFINKPLSLMVAERHSRADILIWLDADTLILKEPSELLLEEGVQFAACATDKNIGTTGPGDEFHGYWEAMCQALGMAVEDLPFIHTCRENLPIRLYFNGGVFAYRPSSGYRHVYLDVCHRLLDARLALRRDFTFYHEQAGVGLALVQSGLKWKPLSDLLNYPFGSRALDQVDPQKFRDAKILHFHKAMKEWFWPQFLDLFKEDRPDVRDWLAPFGPLDFSLPLGRRAFNKVIRTFRQPRIDRYKASCRIVN